jgi:hypothetical protein
MNIFAYVVECLNRFIQSLKFDIWKIIEHELVSNGK